MNYKYYSIFTFAFLMLSSIQMAQQRPLKGYVPFGKTDSLNQKTYFALSLPFFKLQDTLAVENKKTQLSYELSKNLFRKEQPMRRVHTYNMPIYTPRKDDKLIIFTPDSTHHYFLKIVKPEKN